MARKKRSAKIQSLQPRSLLIAAFISTIVLGFALAWISSNFTGFYGWSSFAVVIAFGWLLLWLAWRVLHAENLPRWIILLTLGAILFRLALGAVWFVALPAGGYDTDVQNAGYVMEDAFNRDAAAWQLSQSEQPLWIAFQGFSSSDQYGGLLFFSAAIYRYVGSDQHQPLLVLALAAVISGLAVAFTWAFARRAWGEKIALLAAWGLTIYPEAALLGSSQMREAFTVALVPLGLYGLLRVRAQANMRNAGILLIPILIALPISWPFTSSLLLLLLLANLALDDWRLLRIRWVLPSVVIALVAGLMFAFLYLDIGNLWLVQAADWQVYVSANASGWVAREFERMPLWGQVPFLVIYGIFRPLLPAALVADGPPIWTIIGIWRAVGWTALLGLLVYATFLVFRSREWRRLPGALLLSTWIVTLTASYRGGGDLWDSPRYRSAFAGVQLGLAAWAWVRHNEQQDPWLRRAVGGGLFVIAWFIPWYLRRYAAFEWPIVELHQVLGLGLVSATLYVVWDWISS